jgi:hypothetical protein
MTLYLNTPLNEELNYLFSSQSEIKVKGYSLMESKTTQQIAYRLCEKDARGSFGSFSLELTVTSTEADLPVAAGNVSSVGQLLNIPYERLVFQLYSNGEVQEVLNQKEIAGKWEDVKKKEEFQSLLAGVNEKKFIQEMDNAYADSIWRIRETPLYIVFFPPVYRLLYDDSHSARYEQTCKSILFIGNTIRFKTHLKFEKIANGIVFFTSRLLKFDTDDRDMRKLYQKAYGALVNTGLDYHFLFEADYQYELQTGRLLSAQAVFEEQANRDLIYKNTINIYLKKEEL